MAIKLNEQLSVTLPEGFTVRGATLDDVEASLQLYNLWSNSVLGEDEITDAESVRNEWVSPGFDPAEDIRLVYAPDNTLVGYVEAWTTARPPIHPWLWARLHPDYSGLGIGSWMLDWAENRCLKALDELDPELRFAPHVGIYAQAKDSQKLFADFGYKRLRSSYEMLIEMDAMPPAPVWPESITVRAYREGDIEAIYRTHVDAFRDHFGFVEAPFKEGFENFKHFMIEVENFDPSLWYLAMDDGEIDGICLCRPQAMESADIGYVHVLGVRREWRKRGLGLAFLHHAFGEFYQRGKRKVSLGVDAENLTGALRLYEKAGMHIHSQFDTFEKEIRPGKEISVQALEE